MQIQINLGETIGEQKGSLRPLATFIALLAVITMAVPATALAATTYLRNNAESFVDKTTENYGEMINVAGLLHDYDTKMITAVIIVESEGKEKAVSNKGAQGLMQLMPGTAKAMGAKNPKEPFQNILAGTKYLKELEHVYGFDSAQEALVAYNMGPSRAKRWLSEYDANDYGYVKKVMYVYGILEAREVEAQRLAEATELKMNVAQLYAMGTRPLMTRPKNLSLAQLPATLPLSRKETLITEDSN